MLFDMKLLLAVYLLSWVDPGSSSPSERSSNSTTSQPEEIPVATALTPVAPEQQTQTKNLSGPANPASVTQDVTVLHMDADFQTTAVTQSSQESLSTEDGRVMKGKVTSDPTGSVESALGNGTAGILGEFSVPAPTSAGPLMETGTTQVHSAVVTEKSPSSRTTRTAFEASSLTAKSFSNQHLAVTSPAPPKASPNPQAVSPSKTSSSSPVSLAPNTILASSHKSTTSVSPTDALTPTTAPASTNGTPSPSPGTVPIPGDPRNTPVKTTQPPPAVKTTQPPPAAKTPPPKQGVPGSVTPMCPPKGRQGFVSQCLIAIALVAALATIFMVTTVILCTKLSALRHRQRHRETATGTELTCISALLPDGGVPYQRHKNPKSNGALIPQGGAESDDDGGDNLTLNSFLPENDRSV